jgi:putative oxidoreductase
MPDTPRSPIATSIGLLILRVGVSAYFATHGWAKLQKVLDGQFDQFADPIGLGSGTSLVLVMVAEFICAILVALGFATRLAAIPAACAMVVAAFVVHADDPWTMGAAAQLFRAGEAESWSSKEPALLYLIPYVALIFTGAGMFSIDHLILRRWRSRGAERKPASDDA